MIPWFLSCLAPIWVTQEVAIKLKVFRSDVVNQACYAVTLEYFWVLINSLHDDCS